MRRNTPLSPYNRRIAFFKPDKDRPMSQQVMGHSQLANLAAGESKLIISLLDWSGGPDAIYSPSEGVVDCGNE